MTGAPLTSSCQFPRRFVCLLACLGFLGTQAWTEPGTARAQEEVRPRKPAQPMSFHGANWLERKEREEQEQPDQVVEVMGLEPGDVVADIGCGSGYFARRMARLVAPGGKVYGVDIQPEMLKIMAELAEKEGIQGIEAVLGTTDDPKLPAGEIDWMILADVYHEFSEPEKMLAHMRRSLAPGGRVALLEYRVEDGTGDHIKADHTMSVRQVLGEWKTAGFELKDLLEFLPSQHLFIFGAASTDGRAVDALVDVDLHEALAAKRVQTEAVGTGAEGVAIRIRRVAGQPRMVLTAAAGTFFASSGEARSMVARRDAAILLDGDGWQEWPIRAVGHEAKKTVPGADDRFEIHPATTHSALSALMHAIQAGTYQVGSSPELYIPRTHRLEQAAVWITAQDATFADIEPHLEGGRVPPRYAAAFALVFCDLGGIEVTTRRIWKEHKDIFAGLRDQGLNLWYKDKLTP